MKISSSIEKKEIIVFSVTVLTLSSLLCFISYELDDPNISILAVFTPSIVALVLIAIANGRKGVFVIR